MSPALSIVAVLLALAVVATATGFAFARLFRIPLLRRTTPEMLAVSAFLGTGLLALAFGWGSYLCLPAAKSATVALVFCACLAVGAIVARPRSPAPRLAGGAVLGLAVALQSALILLPILIGGAAMSFDNDEALYVSAAQWLQST